jgi:hypothetical protein
MAALEIDKFRNQYYEDQEGEAWLILAELGDKFVTSQKVKVDCPADQGALAS